MLEESEGRLAGVLAHQLGAGVAVIDACTSMLRDPDGSHADVVTALEAVGRRLRRVDEDLHDLVRIARRRATPKLVRASDALTTARLEFASDGTRDPIEVRSTRLPRVYADGTHLERLFVHLLHLVANAGAAAIAVSARSDAGGALFLVADEDSRLDRGDAESLLESPRPGQRLRLAGTSVSLEVCRAILDWHGGRIGVHSDAAGRLAVAFNLPTAPQDASGA